jgi:hypothetical protein
MIFILWHAFIILEVALHYFVIEVIQYDLTPDKYLITWSKVLVVIVRFIAFFGLWWAFGIKADPEFWMYFSGALASHLLLFPVLLNFVRYKPLDYLGKGLVDRILGILPPLARWWFLLVISAGAWYGYFNTDLL